MFIRTMYGDKTVDVPQIGRWLRNREWRNGCPTKLPQKRQRHISEMTLQANGSRER